MKGLAVLGSTGVVGSLALEVVRDYPKDFKIISLVGRRDSKKLRDQVREFKPKIVVATEKDGEEAMIKAVEHSEVDLVVVAVVGMAGLRPILAAIKAGKDVALATKEVLVVAGEIVMREAEKYGVNLIPLDSEHSAIWQSLKSGKEKEIKRVYLTMGKGRLSEMKKEELKKIKLKDVLKRKTWVMGQKIGVDSATCMNKAFEIVEAKWLFGLKSEQIKIVVHPEYLCHSLVEFVDGSWITELGIANMKRYVQYGLFYPERREIKRMDEMELIERNLSFEKPPMEKFLGLKLGYQAIEKEGTMPAVMHGADGVVVEFFAKGKLGFMEMTEIIKQVMDNHKVIKKPDLRQVIKAEKWGGERAKELIKRRER